MQPKNLLKKNSVTMVDGKQEVLKVIGTPFGPFTRYCCRHETDCLTKLAKLGFVSAPKLIRSTGSSFTMEKIEGKSLNGSQCLEEPLFSRVMEVVAQLHDFGFAHGNLRPNNILITEGNEPVLIDFETCCQRSNPLFSLVKFSDHVRLHLLWQSRVVKSDQGRAGTEFPRHVTVAMFFITPINRIAAGLKAVKKRLRSYRNVSAKAVFVAAFATEFANRMIDLA